MKFPVDKCEKCGLDLTTAEPAGVTYSGETAVGACPECGDFYFMLEVTPPPPPPEPVVEPEPPTPRGGRRRASEPTLEPEPEAPEPATEPEPEE